MRLSNNLVERDERKNGIWSKSYLNEAKPNNSKLINYEAKLKAILTPYTFNHVPILQFLSHLSDTLYGCIDSTAIDNTSIYTTDSWPIWKVHQSHAQDHNLEVTEKTLFDQVL